ncbi:MAG: hypothetical protein D6767_06275 [Candidatus Hydrogenedentota bacterium]|nr:MAG: hypothetical protein D6767_06275 [Candidatus Hydrogenedentota bacterium]
MLNIALFFILFFSSNIYANFHKAKFKISGKFIKAMHYEKGSYWIATERGLYEIKNGQTKEYLKGEFITSFAIDHKRKVIWAGTPTGLLRYDLQSKKITKYTKQKRQLSNNKVNTILLDGDVLYIGNRLGVDRFDIVRNTWKAYTALEGLAGNDIQDLKSDGTYIWAGGMDGISYYDKNEDFWLSYGTTEGLNNPFVTSISVDTEAVWVGTAGGGVSRFDRSSLRFEPLTVDEGLVDDQVQCIVDDGLFLWIGTFDGVSRLSKKTLLFKNYRAEAGLTEPSVFAALVVGENFYAGTDGSGVFVFNKSIPEARLLASRYQEPKKVAVYARVLSSSGISSWDLQYKPFDKVQAKWVKTGIRLSSPKKGDKVKVAEIDTSKLTDGLYLLRFTVKDSKGKINESRGSFIVDNTPPKVKLIFRELPKDKKEVMVTGRYMEENLLWLKVYLAGKAIPAKRVIIDRQFKKFRFPYRVGSGAKITVEIADIALNKNKITQEYSVDTKPPKLTVNEIDKNKIEGNVVTITGTVEDENLDEVIINPGQITAELTPISANKYEFKAQARIRKEGKFSFLVTALDKGGRKTNKKVTLNFTSDVTIVELDTDKIPDHTLRDFVEFSGSILGPLVKELYVMVNNKEKVEIPVDPKTKEFKKKVKLQKGKNQLKLVAIHKTGEKTEEIFEVEYVKKKVSARLNLEKRAFQERSIVVTGSFDKGIRKVLVNGKPTDMDFETNTYTAKVSLKRGRNKLKITSVDELGRVSHKKEIVYYDTKSPDLFVRTLPSKTGIQDLKFRGRVQDISPVEILVFPKATIEYFNLDDGSFEGSVQLKKGFNRITFLAVDDAGNKSRRTFTVEYDPKYPKLMEEPGAANAEEIARLKKEIARLKKLLLTKGKYIPGIIQSKLPKKAGLYLVPLAGKIKNYAVAAQLYLGSKELKELVAMYNAKDPKNLRKVLVPSPSYFALMSRSRNRKKWNRLVRKMAQAYIKKPAKKTVEKTALSYLLRRRLLRKVQEKKNYVLFELKDGSCFIVGNVSPSTKSMLKNKYKEVLLTKLSKRGMLFSL